MGYNNGTYTRNHNFSADGSAGVNILAARMDTEFDDLASALTNVVWTRDGNTVPAVDIPMGGRKHINVAAATSVGNYMRVREFIENVPIYMRDETTSTDSVRVSSQYFTSVSANQAPSDGTSILVKVASNKSSAVLYLDGHSANIEYQDGNRIGPAMVSGGLYWLTYSSADTAWKIDNPDDGRTAAEIAAGVTPTAYQYPEGNALRYGLSTTGTASANKTALENAYAVAAQGACRVFIPAGSYPIEGPIVFDTPDVIIEGEGRDTTLDFSGQSSGQCIVVGDVATPNGMAMNRLRLLGKATGYNENLTGLTINDVGSSINVARCNFDKLFIRGFGVGIEAQYWTTSSMTNCTVDFCGLGLNGAVQLNNILLNIWFANCDKFWHIQNSDNVNFVSSLFQNITDDTETYAMTARQSGIVLIGPYVENLESANMIRLGGPGDAIGCSLQIIGGKIDGGHDIVYRENIRHLITVEGPLLPLGADLRIRTESGSGTYYYIPRGRLQTRGTATTSLNGSLIGQYWYDNKLPFGNATSHVPRPDYVSEISRTGDVTVTFLNLDAESYYTLVYCMRRPTDMTVAWRERTGGAAGTIEFTASISDAIPLTTDDLEVRYIPFKAIGDTLQLIFGDPSTNGALELNCLLLFKGCVFPEPEIFNERPLFASAAPTASTWAVGDRVWNIAPSVDGNDMILIGWVCVTAGTPGTWEAMYASNVTPAT